MAIPTIGKNKIRDLISSSVDYIIMGTNGDDFDVSDTGVKAPVNDTKNNVVITKTNKSFQTQATVLSTQGNGNTLKEVGVYFDDDVILDRFVIPDLVKTDQIEVVNIAISRIN